MPWVPLDVALQLVRMLGEAGDSRYEAAVCRWLVRWIEEEKPSVEEVAATACSFVVPTAP